MLISDRHTPLSTNKLIAAAGTIDAAHEPETDDGHEGGEIEVHPPPDRDRFAREFFEDALHLRLGARPAEDQADEARAELRPTDWFTMAITVYLHTSKTHGL